MDGFQDFRGRLVFSLNTKILSSGVVVCILCLCGFPFLSGFFSKDFILDSFSISFFLYFIFMLSVLITIAYSFRFSFYALKSTLIKHSGFIKIYENLQVVICSVWVLVRLGVFLGYVWLDLISFYFIFFNYFSSFWKLTYISFVILVSFVLFSSLGVIDNIFLKKHFLSKMFFLSLIFKRNLFSFPLVLRGHQDKSRGQGWLEQFGPQKIFSVLIGFSWRVFRVEAYQFLRFIFMFIIFSIIFFWLHSLSFKAWPWRCQYICGCTQF